MEDLRTSHSSSAQLRLHRASVLVLVVLFACASVAGDADFQPAAVLAGSNGTDGAANTIPADTIPEADQHCAPVAGGERLLSPLTATNNLSVNANSSSESASDTASCVITEQELHGIDPRQYALIDIRDESGRAQGTIVGALRMPVSVLAEQSIFIDQKLLLIGHGFDHWQQQQACRDLRQRGFTQVHVLAGGSATWIKNRLPYDATLAPRAEPFEISHTQLVQQLRYGRVRLVSENPEIPATIGRIFPQQSIDYIDRRQVPIKPWLARQSQKLEQAGFDSLVLIGNDRQTAMLAATFAEQPIANVYFLRGDQDSINSYVQKQVLANRARAQPSTGSQQCGS